MATSRASRPLSAASATSFRIALNRTLIVAAARPRFSSSTRYLWTAALFMGGLPVRCHHKMNSVMAVEYARFE